MEYLFISLPMLILKDINKDKAHPLITQRPLHYMKQAESVFSCGLLSIIFKQCHLTSTTDGPSIIYEDNVACIAQGDKTKHISPKFFYTYEL